MIKHALIADADYWQKIKKAVISDSSVEFILSRSEGLTIGFESFDTLIETSIHIKNKIVQEDPFEKSSRKALNFGHTVGHAIETYFWEQHNRLEPLLHGEAIAAGMICEAYLSNSIVQLSDDALEDIPSFILSLYAPIQLKETDFDRLIELMFHDKKNEKKIINFSLLSSIGKCEINKTASADLIKESLRYYSECASKSRTQL
jgi:3-dehydroquinate synthase